MELREITEAMSSTDADAVKNASRKLENERRHRSYNLRVIASLLANGHDEAARRFAAETGTDIEPNAATERALFRLGNPAERQSAANLIQQRRERLENSEVWQLVMRAREAQQTESA